MDGNLTIRQESLKRKLGRFREAARLGERESFLPKECQREFPLQFELTDVGCRENFV
jgi:hypothetical protein